MSPIDDELRATLHGRASVLAPSPDPLAGIERRAKRIQRNRIGAAVAASALAVSAIAVAVPALQSATSSGPNVPNYATTPSAQPELSATTYPLDPRNPWAYRGIPRDQFGTGTLETIAREYAIKRRVAEGAVQVTPLFGQIYEPSQQLEIVFLAEVDGSYRWGVVAATEGGPEFTWDEELAEGQDSLAAALPGDEVPRLLVVAAPEATSIEYGPDDASEFVAMSRLADGVATGSLEGDPATDRYQVTWPSDDADTVSAERPAPDVVAPEDGAGTVSQDEAAAYSFDPAQPWPFRGLEEVDGDIVVQDERLFYEARPARRNLTWATRPLYYGKSDAGMHYLFMLHTAEGEEPVVTTTWQRGDREHEQTEQGVEPGQKLLQAIVPTDLDDGSVMLVALASPRAGGIVLEQPDRKQPDGIGDPGVGLWLLDQGKRDGEIVLYTEGDGVEYYRNPVDVGPDAYDE